MIGMKYVSRIRHNGYIFLTIILVTILIFLQYGGKFSYSPHTNYVNLDASKLESLIYQNPIYFGNTSDVYIKIGLIGVTEFKKELTIIYPTIANRSTNVTLIKMVDGVLSGEIDISKIPKIFFNAYMEYLRVLNPDEYKNTVTGIKSDLNSTYWNYVEVIYGPSNQAPTLSELLLENKYVYIYGIEHILSLSIDELNKLLYNGTSSVSNIYYLADIKYASIVTRAYIEKVGREIGKIDVSSLKDMYMNIYRVVYEPLRNLSSDEDLVKRLASVGISVNGLRKMFERIHEYFRRRLYILSITSLINIRNMVESIEKYKPELYRNFIDSNLLTRILDFHKGILRGSIEITRKSHDYNIIKLLLIWGTQSYIEAANDIIKDYIPEHPSGNKVSIPANDLNIAYTYYYIAYWNMRGVLDLISTN